MRAFIAALLGLANLYPLLAQLRPAVPVDTLANPEQIVAHFEAHDEPAAQAIFDLGIAAKIPMGLVLTDPSICDTMVGAVSDQMQVSGVLDKLLMQIGEYEWSIRDGVVVVTPKAVPPVSMHILDAVIPRYANATASMDGSAQYLYMMARATLQPGDGFSLHVLSSSLNAQVPAFEMRNATAEAILNHIVIKGGGGVWVLSPLGRDSTRLPDKSLIRAFGYEDPNVGGAASELCGMLRPQKSEAAKTP